MEKRRFILEGDGLFEVSCLLFTVFCLRFKVSNIDKTVAEFSN
jgi:hypothetical protein